MGNFSMLEPYRLYDLEYRTKFAENSDKYFEEMVKESLPLTSRPTERRCAR